MQVPKWAIVAGMLVVVAILLNACGPQPSTPTPLPPVQTALVTQAIPRETTVVAVTATASAQPPGPAVLRVNVGAYPAILDPQRSARPDEIGTLRLIYEGLTRLDSRLQTVPGGADRWEYNADATVLTFHIRESLRYSDGTPLNAKRFEYALLRNIDPATGGAYAAITDDIVGAAEWRTAAVTATGYDPAAFIAHVGVKALDAQGQPCMPGAEGYAQDNCRTLRVDLRQPAAYFHTVMSLWVAYPVKEENLHAGGEQWWNSSTYQTGNGPFVLTAVEPFVRQHFIPNQRYWRGQASYEIEYRYAADLYAAIMAYKHENAEFDVISGAGAGAQAIHEAMSEDDRGDEQVQLVSEARLYAGSCTYALMLQQEREPFRDKKVREAFAQAIDRDALVRDTLGGLGAPTLTWIPPGYPGYGADETRWAFDPEKAKAALAESSYGGAAGLPPVQWTFGDTASGRARAEWFAAQLQTNLGVTVELDPVEPATFTAMTQDKATAPLAFELGWCADDPDPHTWLSVYGKTGAFAERIGYSNPEVDALLTQGDTTVDPALRLQYYRDAQRLIVGDLPAVMLHHDVHIALVKPWVIGFRVTPQDVIFPGDLDPLAIRIDRSRMP